MRQDRFLVGILVGIGILVVISLALFFMRQEQADYLPDGTPESAVHNYVLALQKRDFQRAYAYLPEGENKPGLARFQQSFSTQELNLSGSSVEVGEANIDADGIATVNITVIRTSGGLFTSINREPQLALLKQENGSWKITSIPYPYWGWDWYQQIPAEKQNVP